VGVERIGLGDLIFFSCGKNVLLIVRNWQPKASCKSMVGEQAGSWSPYLMHAAVAIGAISVAAAANHYWRSCEGGRRRAVGIIPARYKSSRFEGKPLALIMGKPMILVIAPLTFSSSNHPGNAFY
jgi:hypothetical protein